MRVIGDIPHPACKITLFYWNQKYLVKIEQGLCEQTFKIPSLDVSSEADFRSRIDERFITSALARFECMNQDLGRALGHDQRHDQRHDQGT